jgi:hypothetical protein
MGEQLTAVIVDESKWLTASMALALLTVALLLYRHRGTGLPGRRRVLAAMTLFFGVTIGSMAFGHLLAVTVKLALGTLEGSVPAFYAIGVALAAPSWWLIGHTRGVLASERHGRKTLLLNAWMAATLLSLGPYNLPLALPAFLNISYHLHSRRAVGWALVGAAAVLNVGLFVGSQIFLASGQSFERFAGVE